MLVRKATKLTSRPAAAPATMAPSSYTASDQPTNCTPVVPVMSTGATDGIYLSAVGIPTYGVTGFFVDPYEGNIHGLNERIRVQSLMDGRRFQYKLVKRLADR